MDKTGRQTEKQDELLAKLVELEPDAIRAARLERAKPAAVARAVALLEQEAEARCGERYERKRVGQGYRGGYEQTSVVVEGAT